MWFEWDGQHVLLSHTKRRAKYRDVRANPRRSYTGKDRYEFDGRRDERVIFRVVPERVAPDRG